jgi:phosphoribosylaminoimidazole (AIR) synthetase
MVAVVDEPRAAEAIALLERHGERAFRIGRVVARAAGAPGCTVEHLDAAWLGA